MKLGIVYHMPFWKAEDGSLWEGEGSFARYVDSLAPYFDEISLCVPVREGSNGEGTRVRARNVRLIDFPYFDGPRQFLPQLGAARRALRNWVPTLDVLNCRVPTPAGWFAFREARRAGVPVFLLVVGDLRAVAPTLPYRGLKRLLFGLYTEFEERALSRMTHHAITFANGAALAAKHRRPGVDVVETRTSTINAEDIDTRLDTCQHPRVRILTVSRIDPRKNLRCLPEAVAALRAAGHDVELVIVGPVVGAPGAAERAAIEASAQAMGIGDRVRCPGSIPLDRLLPMFREYDLFVLPTGPGEGIPRVLLEAMSAGLPVVTTNVAGIPSLIAHEKNGLFLDAATGGAVAAAVGRLMDDGELRRRLIQSGYETARAHTLDAQAAHLMGVVAARLGVQLPRNDDLSISSRRRVCFVLPSLAGGGAERAAVQILNALDGHVWDRSMYLFKREGPYLNEVDGGVRVVAGDQTPRRRRVTGLRQFIRTEKPDVVMVFLSYFSVMAAVRAALRGTRVIFNQQTPISAFLADADYRWRLPIRRRLFTWLARLSYPNADAVVATSHGVADELRDRFGVAEEHLHVVPNPVDLKRIDAAMKEPLDAAHDAVWTRPAVVAAGRLADAKNYPLMLDAFAIVRRQMPARLFILGTGELEPALRGRVHELGLDDDVVFCGFQPNPWKFVARSDVFLLTSHYEGFGNVLIEAMACRVPVVATASHGTKEIVNSGHDGVIVERHEPEAVASALMALLRDTPSLARMREAARCRAERFAMPAVAAEYDRVFQTVLS
jgi:glycosyltransferase involved in cell wall biosynthesis